MESDFEYISLVYQLLPENQKEKWVNIASPNPTWESFYSFLGEVYEKALLKKQINDSCKQNSGQERKFCTNCKKGGHLADKCHGGKCNVCTDNKMTQMIRGVKILAALFPLPLNSKETG